MEPAKLLPEPLCVLGVIEVRHPTFHEWEHRDQVVSHHRHQFVADRQRGDDPRVDRAEVPGQPGLATDCHRR